MNACILCGHSPTIHETRDIERRYQQGVADFQTTIKDVTGLFCDGCGKIIFTEEENAHYLAQLQKAKFDAAFAFVYARHRNTIEALSDR